jgi:hypothetical protein
MASFAAWLAAISASTAGPGQPFQASWSYVAMALTAPALIGLAAALLLLAVEKTCGIRLGGGGI